MTTGNEKNKGQTRGGTNSQWMGCSCLACDMRDRVLFRTARRNHYPAAWEFATTRGPKHLLFPSQSSQAFETAVLKRWPRGYEIPKYFARTTSPRWDECAYPKVLWKIYITIEAPHVDHRSRRPRYWNILINKKIRRGWFNPCFILFNQNCAHRTWRFEIIWRKEDKG